jgi:hypothetical protein
MRTNIAIAALIYPMIQAVLFGLGLLALLAMGAPAKLFPGAIAATFVLSAPIALVIAPRLRSRAWRREHGSKVVPS